jgi:chemotaxis protein MotA
MIAQRHFQTGSKMPGVSVAPTASADFIARYGPARLLPNGGYGLVKEQSMLAPSRSVSQSYAPGPLAGAAFGLVVVLSPIGFGAHGVLALFSLTGLVIVLGGVTATSFMSFAAADVTAALRAIAAMLKQPRAEADDLTREMNRVLCWVRDARSGGLSGLRAAIDRESAASPFVNYGLNMVLSEYPAEEVGAMLRTAAEASYDRDCVPIDVLRAMASHAPAFGMIGTLVGMIAMLCELNENIVEASSTLAVAFVSTLYGVASARMIYMPAAARLQREVDGRHRRHHLLAEGLILLARGETPSRVQDRLNGFLRPEQRDYFDAIGAEARAPRRPVALLSRMSAL